MPRQSSQLELPFGVAYRAQQSRRHIQLGSRIVTYILTRERRRNLSMTIDHRGLRVGASCSVSIDDIEQFVRTHSGWVLRKLDEWQRHFAGAPKLALRDGEQIPLVGGLRALRIRQGANRVLFDESEIVLEARRATDVAALLTRGLRDYAHQLFEQRLARFAPGVGRPVPRLTLSTADTRWGSCSAKGGIRLNWRLVHLPLGLIDYVAAHELAHLIEMNHSPRFWAVVERMYPEYRVARAQLKSCAAQIPEF